MLGVIILQGKERESGLTESPAEALAKNRQAIAALAKSGEAQKLMAMLQKQGGVQDAARAAAAGNTAQLMAMMERLLGSREGAELVERITDQARKSGLDG